MCRSGCRRRYSKLSVESNAVWLLLIMGSVEILFEWRGRHHSHLLPLDRYGQVVSFLWYVGSFSLVGVILVFRFYRRPATKPTVTDLWYLMLLR